MPITHGKIKTPQQLNRVINAISKRLDEFAKRVRTLGDIDDTAINKFETWFQQEVENVSSYLKKESLEDERVERFLGRFRELKQTLRPEIRPVDVWATKRAAEIAEEHAAWDKHVAERPVRMQKVAEENEAAREQPIQSRRQMRKAIGELNRAKAVLHGPDTSPGERVDARTVVETKDKHIMGWLGNKENRANPNDEVVWQRRMERLNRDIDEQIKKLSDALLKLQKAVPALDPIAKDMAKLMMAFQLSKRDGAAFKKLQDESKILIEKILGVKDPMVTRIWHSFIVAIKSILNYLDKAQAILSGKRIDRSDRTHTLSVPRLPVYAAKLEYQTALYMAIQGIEDAMDIKPSKGG